MNKSAAVNVTNYWIFKCWIIVYCSEQMFFILFRLRKSLHKRLLQLRNGVLSEVMRTILAKDPLAPVLIEPYYEAMDRRLVHVLDIIDSCVEKNGPEFVLISDQFSEPS